MQYLCNGYTLSLEELINGALFESQNDEMVIVRDIEQCSLCEHHMQPFIGKAHGAYIPTRRVLGLSKIARVVDGVRVIIDFTSLQAIGRQCECELCRRFEEHRSRFPQKNFNSFWPYPFEFRQAFFERATIGASRNNVADLAIVFSIHFVS